MEQIAIRVRFGVGNERAYTVSVGTTIGQIKADATNKSTLGYPANVRALIYRVEQPDHTQVSNGDLIDLETVGTSKAA